MTRGFKILLGLFIVISLLQISLAQEADAAQADAETNHYWRSRSASPVSHSRAKSHTSSISVSASASPSRSQKASRTQFPFISLIQSLLPFLSPSASPLPPCPRNTTFLNTGTTDVNLNNACTAPSRNFTLTFVGGGGSGDNNGDGAGGGASGGIVVSPVDAGSVFFYNVTVGIGGVSNNPITNSTRTVVTITYTSGGVTFTNTLIGYRGGNSENAAGGGGGGAGSAGDGGDSIPNTNLGAAGGPGAAPGGRGDDDDLTTVDVAGNGTQASSVFNGIGELTSYSGGGGGSMTNGGSAVGHQGGPGAGSFGGGGASFLADGQSGMAVLEQAGPGAGGSSPRFNQGGGGYFELDFN